VRKEDRFSEGKKLGKRTLGAFRQRPKRRGTSRGKRGLLRKGAALRNVEKNDDDKDIRVAEGKRMKFTGRGRPSPG